MAALLAQVNKQLRERSGTANMLAPYTPTPDEIIEETLNFANVVEGDVVFDVGCGDARLLCAAVRRGAIKGIGWDVEPKAIEDATKRIAQEGVAEHVQVFCKDIFQSEVPWHEATLVILYLSVQGNLRMRSTLLQRLKPGARIVTVQFNMGLLQPTRTTQISHTGHHADAAFVPLYLYEVSDTIPELDTEAELFQMTQNFRHVQ